MLLKQLFDIGEELELRNARMYAHFSLLHSDDERIAQTWEQMSTDEWQHYILLNYCKGLCENCGQLEKPAPEISEKGLQETRDILDAGEKKLHSGTLTLNECFEASIALEKGETDNIFHKLVGVSKEVAQQFDNQQAYLKIKKAEKKAENHTDRLLQAVKRFANSPDLVRQAQKKLSGHH
ncbi:hypothetical protein [Candidatus Uabimicrobium amorphum]|uniref:Rubrerythrin diiron-binding domain-containing protein n=1 Tax=Uabimicrobium amorphum TaxID=2596890 RepID=A0A5S9F5L1_UABAM|nr:hypothetical protein [Candidatus Uabimicrobium amorphum]BBM86431.1 hypothetical protein UABAM_04817 [Candidatus Uabimicrobium amorphum]